jgi:long-chain acyl-CoA synthetase
MRHESGTAQAGGAAVVPGSATLGELLLDNARRVPRAVALREKDLGIWQEYTWRGYLDEVLALAAGLEALGFSEGDALIVLGDNRPRLYFGMLAASVLRGIPVPVFPDAIPDEVRHIVGSCEARFALAEDQEQIDKLLDLRKRTGHLEVLVFDDPRGLGAYPDSGLRAYAAVRARGVERLGAEPELRDALVGRARPGDPAVLLHSSGTTGAPKGIMLAHRQLLAAVRNARACRYFEEGEEIVAYLPMAWVGDFVFSVAAAIALGFTVNIPERQETVLENLQEIAPTLYFAPPRSWDQMLTQVQVRMEEAPFLKRWLYHRLVPVAVEIERARMEGRSASVGRRLLRALGEPVMYGPLKDYLGLSRVRRAYTGGEAVGEDTFLFFRGLGVNLKQIYGQTENSALTSLQGDDEVRLHTVGRPLLGVEVRIGDAGEILLRSESLFEGYRNNPEATAKVLRDGWFHTGDAGYLDPDGQLVILGRVEEMVQTRGGQRFVAQYVENRLKFSPFIREAAVLGAGRAHLAAMVCIDFDAVGHWAEVRGIPYTSYADLSQKPEVYRLIGDHVRHVNRLLLPELAIRRFVNLHKEFDPDDGELTRTRKLRRQVIEERYGPIIEALYDGQPAVDVEARITYETGETGTIRRRLTLEDVA